MWWIGEFGKGDTIRSVKIKCSEVNLNIMDCADRGGGGGGGGGGKVGRWETYHGICILINIYVCAVWSCDIWTVQIGGVGWRLGGGKLTTAFLSLSISLCVQCAVWSCDI